MRFVSITTSHLSLHPTFVATSPPYPLIPIRRGIITITPSSDVPRPYRFEQVIILSRRATCAAPFDRGTCVTGSARAVAPQWLSADRHALKRNFRGEPGYDPLRTHERGRQHRRTSRATTLSPTRPWRRHEACACRRRDATCTYREWHATGLWLREGGNGRTVLGDYGRRIPESRGCPSRRRSCWSICFCFLVRIDSSGRQCTPKHRESTARHGGRSGRG
jgi:hypothetical protein